MAGHELVTEGFAEGQVGSSAMPHKMNTRSCERVNGLAVVLRGYLSMVGELAGDQWNEGDVSCSVVRRVALPDAFFAADGLFQTFLTVLDEFGAFPAVIQRELDRYLPFLATTKVLMAAVRNGVGREVAHEAIKEAAVGVALDMRAGPGRQRPVRPARRRRAPRADRASELDGLVAEPIAFTGAAVAQTQAVCRRVAEVVAPAPRRRGVHARRDPLSRPLPWSYGRRRHRPGPGAGRVLPLLRPARGGRLGVHGWVRNEPDGSVAGHFEGDAEAVDALVDWCRGARPAPGSATSPSARAPTPGRAASTCATDLRPPIVRRKSHRFWPRMVQLAANIARGPGFAAGAVGEDGHMRSRYAVALAAGPAAVGRGRVQRRRRPRGRSRRPRRPTSSAPAGEALPEDFPTEEVPLVDGEIGEVLENEALGSFLVKVYPDTDFATAFAERPPSSRAPASRWARTSSAPARAARRPSSPPTTGSSSSPVACPTRW